MKRLPGCKISVRYDDKDLTAKFDCPFCGQNYRFPYTARKIHDKPWPCPADIVSLHLYGAGYGQCQEFDSSPGWDIHNIGSHSADVIHKDIGALKRLIFVVLNIKDMGRFKGACISCVVGVLIIVVLFILNGLVLCWPPAFFYDEPLKGFINLRRLPWCIAWAFLGFAAIAYRSSKKSHKEPAYKSYFTTYPTILVLSSVLVFSVLHLFDPSSTYLFYPLAAALSFILGYSADNFKTNLDALLRRS